MVITTKDFGEVEVSSEDFIRFEDGIYAFETIKEYVILKQEDAVEGFLQLQAVEKEDPRFILFDPFLFFHGYEPHISEDVVQKLGAKTRKELSVFAIAVIPKDVKNTTVNLKSPILINFKTRKGMQLILDNDDYSVRHRIFQNEKGGE